MSNRLLPSRPLALLATALLGACAAQMQPVADFGAAASHLATSYRPFADGLGASCKQRQRYIARGNPGRFDDAASQRDAEHQCAPLTQAGDTANLFARALSDYAGALAKMSHAKATAFDADIKGVSSAASDLATRDGTPLFDSKKLGAATKLARAAAAMVLEEKIQVLTRATLADNHDALTVVVEAMKTYADTIYAGQLGDTRDVMQGELGRLVVASDAPTQADVEARMPWRYAQTATRADLAANALETRRVHAFTQAADALVAAHAELIANFDKIGGARRLELVSAFVQKVQAMSDEAALL